MQEPMELDTEPRVDIEEATGLETIAPTGDHEAFTAREEERLRSAAEERALAFQNGFRQRTVVELALYTGAKVAELARLACGDLLLHDSAPALRIRSGSNPRILPLPPRLLEYFRDYLKRKQAAGESIASTAPLVCSQRGSSLSIRGWQAAWSLAQQHAGLVDGEGRALFNLESARQVVGRRIYRATGNPHHVQAWLGLDLTTNADRYLPENFRITVETLRPIVGSVGPARELRRPSAPSLDLAMRYYNGTIGEMNRPYARKLFLDVPPENPLGQMWIARGLERGRCYFPHNPELAQAKAAKVIGVVREMADEGDPMAVFLYASARDNGLALDQDTHDATAWYHRAADLGSETGINNLALKYYWGRGCDQDDEKAFRLFQHGASLHEASCMFNLALLYYEGMGTERNLEMAVKWYTKAATAGEVRSMNNLSYLYMRGEGVPRDEECATRWYCLSGNVPYATDNVVKPRPKLEMIRVAG